MEEKLEEILEEYLEDINGYNETRKKLRAKIEFCNAHKFSEEARIAQIKFDSISMIIYGWENMYKEIQELLDKWNS